MKSQKYFAFLLGTMVLGAAGASFAAQPPPPIRISENGRYFVKADGTPFFWLGDTAWSIFNHPKPEDVDLYLNDRAAKGFTVIQAYVIRGLGERHPDGEISLVGATPFVDRDPARPNEAFFRNVDYVVNRANELGLVMGLVVSNNGGPQNICIARSAGYGLDAKAAEAVQQYKFAPASKDGEPVAARLNIEVDFRLY